MIKLNLNKPKVKKNQPRERFILENLKDQDCKVRYKNEISSKRNEQRESNGANGKWDGFKRGIIDSATNIVQTKTIRNKKGKQTS